MVQVSHRVLQLSCLYNFAGMCVGTNFNARSVNNKSAMIVETIVSSRLDILALQETWRENSDSLYLFIYSFNKYNHILYVATVETMDTFSYIE